MFSLCRVRVALLNRPGTSFAAGRHTFWSIAGEHPDAEAVKRIMGHSQEGMSRWYVHKNERMFMRLRSVTDAVQQRTMDHTRTTTTGKHAIATR